MMGTINLIENNDEFLRHLNSMASSLNNGGLYLIENFGGLGWFQKDVFGTEHWVEDRNGIMVETTYETELVDPLEQKVKETMTMKVNDHGKEMIFDESRETKLFFPQELKTLVRLNDNFELIGWFSPDGTDILEKSSSNNIVILRKKYFCYTPNKNFLYTCNKKYQSIMFICCVHP